MISLEAYRAKIGSFVTKARHIQRSSHFFGRNQSNIFGDTPNYFYCVNEQYATKYFLRALGVVILMLILTLNLNFSVLKLLKLLTDGDVESNPGPTFKILKVIQGSFHQGHPKFGHTAGIQCACNSLYALCWSTIKRVSVWTTSDLDYVLENGDSLFKSINTNMALNVDELPVNVNIEGRSLDVILLENEAGVMNTTEQFNFLKMSFQTKTNTGTGAIFFINGYTFALIWNKSGIFLCDSHSRNKEGLITADGASVLLKFKTLDDVQNYIKEVYMLSQNFQVLTYQMQFINIEVKTTTDISLIVNSVKKSKKRAQKREYRATIFGTAEHETIKAQQRERNREYRATIFATAEHETIKAQQREKKREYRATIFGTTEHENIKAQLRERNRKCRATIFGTTEHENIKAQQRERKREYRATIFGTMEHENIKAQQREKYASISGTPRHENIKKTMRDHYATISRSQNNIKKFREEITKGPYFICVVCNRCLYRKSVLIFNETKYDLNVESFCYEKVNSYDGCQYICKTCDTKLKKKKIPCQAVWNKLQLFQFPHHIPCLNKLERVIIAKRILFSKIITMPKGQFRKIKGAICNVPIEADTICNILPRGIDSNGLILLKLKRKLCYRGHVLFESVRPDIVQTALNYLKQNNPLYNNVEININNIPIDLLSLEEIPILREEELDLTNQADNLEEVENPLDQYRISANEGALIPTIPCEINEENITVAPGEGLKPTSILTDKHCEELAHPYLFPTGKFGYNIDRAIYLSPVKYFNQRLLNYTQKFSADSDYIFFAHSVTQHLNLNSRINIAMQKVKTNQLTAGMLSRNFKESVKSFVAKDEAYNFMNTIKGTPAYWKRFLFEVLAMVKQLGLPTFFMTLSCADLRWNELVSIISKLNGLNLSEDDIKNLDYFKRCEILNNNPVLLARHFQYRVEVFFKEIIIDGPLGKVKYYAIRVEFQFRGSPHIHSFLWVIGAPVLTKDTKNEYLQYVDHIVKAQLPDIDAEPELYQLVKTYQIHSHSKSCRKYKNKDCRYSFGRFFTEKTIIAEPLPNDMLEQEKLTKLQKRNQILNKVKDYIDTNLDPRKVNILEPEKPNFVKPKEIIDILQELNIAEADYYNALSVSTDSDFQVHFKRQTNSCFVNNYFAEGLLAWQANIDIQPVINHYKAVAYMCAYFSKSEDESSEAMQQAAKEASKLNLNAFEQMKSISKAYSTKRECSVQEAVYHVMPELWLRKTFPGVIFANSNLPEHRYRVCRSEAELLEMPDDSTDVFKRNMLDRYIDRPNHRFAGGKYRELDTFCFAEFIAHYYLAPRKTEDEENDNQPEILNENVLEDNHNLCNYPSIIPLMSSKEKLKCRKVKSVLRYHVPNRHKNPEKYAHHILFMFYPFRDESELCSTVSGTYMEKLSDPIAQATVNENKSKIEPFGDLVDSALLDFRTDLTHNPDSYAQQENDEVEDMLVPQDEDPDEDDSLHEETGQLPGNSAVLMIDTEVNSRIRSLNIKQREIYEVINKWARDYIKNRSCVLHIDTPPLHLFITGSGGCGKSHLIKTVYHSLTKTLCSKNSDKPKVLLLAPTGVAAINIEGMTIHSGLGIPIGHHGKHVPRLGDKMRSKLRSKLSELCVVIIDEISMVSNLLLLYIHQRLVEVFASSSDLPFAGISIIVFGDFYQLPPIQQRTIYAEYKDAWLNLSPLWRLFRIAELHEVMRQKGDNVLIDLLNKVRVADINIDDENLLKSKFVKPEDGNYPHQAIHIWAENSPVNQHNAFMLSNVTNPLFVINAIDILPKNVQPSVINKVLNRNQMETGGLARILELKVNARVMLTSNIDVPDKLSNGQIGTVFHIKVNSNQAVTKIYIKFDDDSAGLKKIGTDKFARQNNCIPIERVEAKIKIRTTKLSSPEIKRTQFPLMLAWACTVHKVQGKQFQEIVISFNLFKQRSWNNGQMYVALSRVTSLDGLYLTGEFNASAIKADPRATVEYNNLRENYAMKTIDTCSAASLSCLTITLLNTRSLKKHAVDIAADEVIKDCDIIFLTETQVESTDDIRTISDILNEFTIIHNIHTDKFCSLASCYKNTIDHIHHDDIPAVTLYNVQKNNFQHDTVNILLVYRKNLSKLEDFIYILNHFLSRMEGDIHIILGDFNINAFEENKNKKLKEVLINYNQILEEPTHISGSLIDQVYIKKIFQDQIDIHATIKNTHFSDHDAVKITLKRKFIEEK